MDVTTVGDLIDYLSTQPRDRRIILAVDSAAHDWSPLADAREGVYVEGGPGKMYAARDRPEGSELVVLLESVD